MRRRGLRVAAKKLVASATGGASSASAVVTASAAAAVAAAVAAAAVGCGCRCCCSKQPASVAAAADEGVVEFSLLLLLQGERLCGGECAGDVRSSTSSSSSSSSSSSRRRLRSSYTAVQLLEAREEKRVIFIREANYKHIQLCLLLS